MMNLAMEVATQTVYTHFGRRDTLLVHMVVNVGRSKNACQCITEEILLLHECARELYSAPGRARCAICTLGQRRDII